MVSKNNLCPYSLKGLYGQIRIMGFSPGDSMNNFIKLNSSFFDHPDHFEFLKTSSSPNPPTLPNFQRDLKFFEDSAYGEILKMSIF